MHGGDAQGRFVWSQLRNLGLVWTPAAEEPLLPCYDVLGGGDFKLGWIGLSGSFRLSGVTPGQTLEPPFRRVSCSAMTGSYAHAE